VTQRRPFSSASRNGHGREVAAFGIAYAVAGPTGIVIALMILIILELSA